MLLASDGNASTAHGQASGPQMETPTEGIIKFFQKRKISPELVTRFSIGSAEHRALGRAITFPYFMDGRQVAIKYRTKDKKFLQDGSCAVTFMNSECIKDHALQSDSLILTEGEIDMLSVVEVGYNRVIGFGAGCPTRITPWPIIDAEDKRYAALYNHKEELSTVKKIILMTDADEAGRFLNIDLRRRFGEYRCWNVDYPEDCKDANDVLVKHGPHTLRQIIENAKPCRIPNVKKITEYPELLPPETFDTGWPWADEHLRLFKPEFMVMTGVPSHGKSTIINALCFNMAVRHNFRIAISSLEMPPVPYFRDSARRYLTDAFMMTVSEADRVLHDNFYFVDPDDEDAEPTLDWYLDRVNQAWLRGGLDMMVLDPWNELSHEWRRLGHGSFTEYVGEGIKEIKRFIRKRDMIGVVVAHPSKMNDKGKVNKPTLYDISDCYSDDTEALTKRGWMRHDQITVNDEVMCFDSNTSKVLWSNPSAVKSFDYNGEMLNFKGYGYDLLVSPNHRMLLKPYWSNPVGGDGSIGRPEIWPKEKWSFIAAKDVPNSRFLLPKSGFSLEGESPDRIKVYEHDFPAEEFCELVGWFVAEGTFISVGASICQALGENEKRIDELFRLCGIETTKKVVEDKRGFSPIATWYIGATKYKSLVKWLSEKCGVGAENKKIPYPFFTLSPELKNAFLNGYIAGDGHRPFCRKGYSAVTTSKQLFDDLQRLCVEIGVPVGGYERQSNNVNHNKQYSINFGRVERRQVSIQPQRNLSTELYNGEIWCLTVPTGAYFVRRNGKVCVSGNSSHWFNKADHGVVIWRVNNSGDIDMDVQKSRFSVFAGKPGIVKFNMKNYGKLTERIDNDGDDIDDYRGGN